VIGAAFSRDDGQTTERAADQVGSGSPRSRVRHRLDHPRSELAAMVGHEAPSVLHGEALSLAGRCAVELALAE
jgi:hypothetical protein